MLLRIAVVVLVIVTGIALVALCPRTAANEAGGWPVAERVVGISECEPAEDAYRHVVVDAW